MITGIKITFLVLLVVLLSMAMIDEFKLNFIDNLMKKHKIGMWLLIIAFVISGIISCGHVIFFVL